MPQNPRIAFLLAQGSTALIALGSGLAAALLLVVSARGTMVAMLLAYVTPLPVMIAVTPLPVMIATLGFGQIAGLAAALSGAGIVAAALHPWLGAGFALGLALPAWWLCHLALLSRPAADAETADLRPSFYPPGRLVLWCAGLAALGMLVAIGLLARRYGSLDAATQALAGALAPSIGEVVAASRGLADGLTPEALARIMLRVMPAASTGSGILMLLVNLWLAGRVAMISGRLPRPWPDVPFELRLPKVAGVVFVVAVGLCFLRGYAAIAASVVAVALGMALALQGLAVVHALLRGSSARVPTLILVYGALALLLPWPLMLAAGLGLADLFLDIRRRRAAQTANPKKPR